MDLEPELATALVYGLENVWPAWVGRVPLAALPADGKRGNGETHSAWSSWWEVSSLHAP